MHQSTNAHSPKLGILVGFILLAGTLRVLFSEIPNIAPIAAMALFGGVYFKNKKLAFLLPLIVMIFSDLILELAYMAGLRQFTGFHETIPFVYAGFIGIVVLGTFFQNRVKPLPIIGASLLSSILFFTVSNFGVWITAAEIFYPMTFSGLLSCYLAALPFFSYTMIGDLLFVGLLFGAFDLFKVKFPTLVFSVK